MKPPVRMVCGDCLESVELEPDGAGRLPTLCPSCGGTIDSALSAMDTPTSNFTLHLPSEPGSNGVTTWTDTWTKGSLGTVGRFQLRELLGDGGFGQVYRAYDPRLDRDVALKVLKQSNPSERVMQRFFREARAAARMAHPNIVAVHDAGIEGGRCWIAYAIVDGRTLSRLLDQPRGDVRVAVRITRDLADALDHAHRAGVVHRDLKPANVIVDAAGRPHLIDFGLASRSDFDSDLTRDGTVLGTPGYMPPEQANGLSHTADERSDVYSLGVMLYELLCGRRPAPSGGDPPPWKAATVEPLPPPRTVNRDIPPALEKMVLRAMELDPKERYPDARAFARDLDGWLKGRQIPAGLSHPLTCVVMGIAATLLLVVAVNATFAPFHAIRPESPPPPGAAVALVSPTAPAETVAQAPTPVSATVIRTKGSEKYHAPGCTHIKNSAGGNQTPMSIEQAEALGLTPCQYYKPEPLATPRG